MASYNRIVLMGNLTKDPELVTVGSGQLCRLSLAINRQFKNKQSGSLVQEVCYVDIEVWGAQAETCRQFLQKGRSVMIEGRLKQDTWKDGEGKTRSKHGVVADRVLFLGGSQSHDSASFDAAVDEMGSSQGVSSSRSSTAVQETVDFKDEPPFSDLPF